MNEGDRVTLSKDVPRPEEYEQMAPDSYYYVHQETGRQIHEESYHGMIEARSQLAHYIEEIEPYET